MNLTKARDYFSAYYEGSLDRGLRQTFEGKLREDAQIQAEYRAFERTMKSLGALGQVEVEPPADLHDRIAARLDKAIWDKKREKASIFSSGWWKNGALIAGAAAILVLGLFIGAPTVFGAGFFFGSASVPNHFTFVGHGHGVALFYGKANKETVVIKSGSQIKDSVDLVHQDISDKLITNSGDKAQLCSIESTDQGGSISYVAIPGRLKSPQSTGRGSLTDLATALAGYYQQPVVVEVGLDAGQDDASWNFVSPDPVAAASDALRSLNLAVTEENGYIAITKS